MLFYPNRPFRQQFYAAGSNKPYLRLHVNCLTFLSVFNQNLEYVNGYSNTQFHGGTSSGSRAKTRGNSQGHDEATRGFS
jgi:hypothetical protein